MTERRRKGIWGRPKIPPENVRRSVSVRLNAAEWDNIRRKADAAGLTPTAWMRLAALSRQLPRQCIPEINREAYAKLAKLAGNLNQLARAANEGRAVVSFPVLKATYDQVKRLRLELLGAADDRQDD